MDQVVDAALELQLGVETGVERDGPALLRGDCPALLARPLDEHLVGPELMAETRTPPP